MLHVNMKQMNRWVVDADNVDMFDVIHTNNGVFYTLAPARYIDALCAFNIFYTLS